MGNTGKDIDYEFLSRRIINLKTDLALHCKNGPLELSAANTRELLRYLEHLHRLSFDFEQQYQALERSHARLGKITGVYDPISPAAKRREAFKLVGGTEVDPTQSSEGQSDD